MCGIIAAFNYKEGKKDTPEDANRFIINQLQDQLNRGQRGFGIIFIDDKLNFKLERATELTKPIVDLYMHKAKMIIMHHRQPTSSENKISQTHPIKVSHKKMKHDYYLIHNGIIYNEDERKEEHEKAGHKYTTFRKTDTYKKEEFNDTEALAIDVARYIEGLEPDIKTVGSVAFICLQVDKQTNKAKQVFFYRNDSSPLHLAKSRGTIRLSSEGQGTDITPDWLYSFNLKDFKLSKRKLVIGSSRYNNSITTKSDDKDTEVRTEDGITILRDSVSRHSITDKDYYNYRGSQYNDYENYDPLAKTVGEEEEALSYNDWYNEDTSDPVAWNIQKSISFEADGAIGILNDLFAYMCNPDNLEEMTAGYIRDQISQITASVFGCLREAKEVYTELWPEIKKNKKETELPEKFNSK